MADEPLAYKQFYIWAEQEEDGYRAYVVHQDGRPIANGPTGTAPTPGPIHSPDVFDTKTRPSTTPAPWPIYWKSRDPPPRSARGRGTAEGGGGGGHLRQRHAIGADFIDAMLSGDGWLAMIAFFAHDRRNQEIQAVVVAAVRGC
jgi:hypothetical protein